MALAKRGDIALVRVALPEAAEGVLLPCVILSHEDYNSSGYVLAVPITAERTGRSLPIGGEECGCELAPRSFVQPDRMLRLHSSSIVKTIGRAKEEFCWEITSGIRALVE
jgi:mRNA-degrading endonuclease toxin of MazEF toxin-antitoxin module